MTMLSGQVAAISGGLGDIGRAIALMLAEAGADIAISDIRSPNEAEATFAQLRKSGRRVRYDRVDVGDEHAVEAWIAAIESDLGTPTLIVPNAAIVAIADSSSITADSWRAQLRVNLDGAFHFARAAALKMISAKKKGRIVFVGSWAGHAAHYRIPAYCVAKAGMRMLMKCMAVEFAPADILVNEVAPGYVDAGLSGRLFDQNPGSREAATQHVPLHRLTGADEVALQVLFLCDPRDRQRTGSVVLMDGGLSLVIAGN